MTIAALIEALGTRTTTAPSLRVAALLGAALHRGWAAIDPRRALSSRSRRSLVPPFIEASGRKRPLAGGDAGQGPSYVISLCQPSLSADGM
jgi:hypothetical protein